MKFSDKMRGFFYSSKAFKVFLYRKDRRLTDHIVIVKDGKFKIEGNGYIVNPERVFFEKKMPCSVYSECIAEPINPLDIDERSKLSSRDFYNAIEATVVQDIIRSSGGKLDATMLMAIILVGAVVIVALVFGIYYLSDLIKTIDLTTINPANNGGLPNTNW